MFPGITSKLSRSVIASATTISPQTDLVRVTGTTAIATINPFFGGGQSGVLFLEPEGAFTFTTAGNIAITSTATAGKLMVLVYDNVTTKWYPSY